MRRVTLSEICDISSGGTPSRSNPDFFRGGIPWAKISDIENADNGFVYSTEEHISADGLKNIRGKLFPKGTLLFAMYGSIGKVAIAGKELSTNQAILGIKPKTDGQVDVTYLKCWFDSNKQKLVNQGRGVALKNLSATFIRNLEIELPTFDDQIRIAHLLSKVEGLIAQRKQHLQQLDDLLKSVFLEMFGFSDGTYTQWPIERLASHTDVVSGVTKGKKYAGVRLVEVPYMRVANVQDGHFIFDEIKTIAVTQKEIDQYQLRRGDLLLTEGGDPDKLGRGSVWEEQVPNCIHQNHIFRVRINEQAEINPYYLSALVGSRYGKAYFLKSAKQTTGIASINSTQLKNFPTVIPPIDLQNHFVSILEKVEGVKSHYQQSFTDLENLYGALSQKAFKGELDLSRISLEPIVGNVGAQEEVGNVVVAGALVNQQPAIDLPDLENMVDALATVEGRQRILQHWLEAYLAQLRDSTFSVNDFLAAAQIRISELHPVDNLEIGITWYEQLKDWIFKALGGECLSQVYDDVGNRVHLAAAKG